MSVERPAATSDSAASSDSVVTRDATKGLASDRPVPVPRTGVPLGIDDPVEKARAELKATLAAIEIKANLPRQVGNGIDKAMHSVREFRRTNPAGAAAAVIGVAAAVGGLVWLTVRAYTR